MPLDMSIHQPAHEQVAFLTLQESATKLQLQLQQETQRSIAVQLDLDQCHAKLQDFENEKNAKIVNLENQLLLAAKNHKKHNLQQAAKQRKAKLEVCLQRHVCRHVCRRVCRNVCGHVCGHVCGRVWTCV